MRTIIAGSRCAEDYAELLQAVKDSGFNITQVVCGGARGADTLGAKWAAANGVPLRLFVPSWGTLGKKAGILRNIQMADNADALIALWDGDSRGTDHMIQTAKNRNLAVHVHLIKL